MICNVYLKNSGSLLWWLHWRIVSLHWWLHCILTLVNALWYICDALMWLSLHLRIHCVCTLVSSLRLYIGECIKYCVFCTGSLHWWLTLANAFCLYTGTSENTHSPFDVKLALTLESFKVKLKTHLYKICYKWHLTHSFVFFMPYMLYISFNATMIWAVINRCYWIALYIYLNMYFLEKFSSFSHTVYICRPMFVFMCIVYYSFKVHWTIGILRT